MWQQGLEYGVVEMPSSNSVLLSKEPEAKLLIKLKIQCMLVPELKKNLTKKHCLSFFPYRV